MIHFMLYFIVNKILFRLDSVIASYISDVRMRSSNQMQGWNSKLAFEIFALTVLVLLTINSNAGFTIKISLNTIGISFAADSYCIRW